MTTAIATQVAFFLKTTTLYGEHNSFVDYREEGSSYSEQIASCRHFPQIIGKGKAISNALKKTRKVAGTDAAVLLLGETGVGKELFAQAIHQHRQRADKPFIAVNVSALTENLLTTDLFGIDDLHNGFNRLYRGEVFTLEVIFQQQFQVKQPTTRSPTSLVESPIFPASRLVSFSFTTFLMASRSLAVRPPLHPSTRAPSGPQQWLPGD